MEDVISLVKELTDGYTVTTCGTSAGGYMSMLVGTAIKADVIFSFSGQFSLWDELAEAPYIERDKELPNKSKYYDLTKFVRGGYYFFPDKCECDIKQYNLIRSIQELVIFPIKNEQHGNTVYSECYPYLLTMSNEELTKLRQQFPLCDAIEPWDLLCRIVPVQKRVKRMLKIATRKWISILKK